MISFFRRGAARGSARVTPTQAHQRTTDGHAVLLDVREQVEWNAGHAPGAVHAPLSRLLAGAALPAAAENRPLVVICRSGHRSQQAAELLTDRGAQAVDVKGGMNAWASAGLPVVDARGSSGRTA
ncbi:MULTISPECIES: rhodanese-like domain-containing protein [unclassified Streptomyces]|uniref:rhodanese-like domain-containing protein n=1 Tax=unclassified Streptomyces TaxID=2593676 RepID=UPI00044B41BD|nr:rhodanese-like domain-containing protein [Streptomyces sp. PCS3-D2]WKV71228.1 rhodanese-like domain-containing protein [Streptomyces sp. PCS3-D2]